MSRTNPFSEMNAYVWGVPSKSPKLRPSQFKDLGAVVGQ
jgi:hypothetical protein